MATSLSLENDSSLAQGYLKVNGSTAATLTTSGITANLTGNVTGNADTATKLSTTTGSAPAYACRAWVNFDGTRDTTGALSTANTNRLIRSSGNVTSVSRDSTGNYVITLSSAMSSSDYSFTGSARDNDDLTTGGVIVVYCLLSDGKNSISFRVRSSISNGTAIDSPEINVLVFGN